MTQPLRSISITETSSLIRAGPPQCLASVFHTHGFNHSRFPLTSRRLVPAVPLKSQDQTHATIYTGPRQRSNQVPRWLILRLADPAVLKSHSHSRCVISRSFSLFVFLIHTCRIKPDFSSTLTTMALYHSSLRWFDTNALNADTGGPTSISSRALRSVYR